MSTTIWQAAFAATLSLLALQASGEEPSLVTAINDTVSSFAKIHTGMTLEELQQVHPAAKAEESDMYDVVEKVQVTDDVTFTGLYSFEADKLSFAMIIWTSKGVCQLKRLFAALSEHLIEKFGKNYAFGKISGPVLSWDAPGGAAAIGFSDKMPELPIDEGPMVAVLLCSAEISELCMQFIEVRSDPAEVPKLLQEFAALDCPHKPLSSDTPTAPQSDK